MSSTITALTSGGGLAMAGDTSGQLELKTNNGTTAVTIDTAQTATFNSSTGNPTLITKVNGTETARFDTSGNLSLSGGGRVIFSNTPPAISIDGINSSVTVTNGNYIDYVNFSGTLMLTEVNFLGGSAILLAGGAGSTTVVGQTNGTAYSNSSGSGQVRWFYNSGTNAIRLQNNSGSTLIFQIVSVKTRNSI